jgi:hypothetical protein
VEDERLNLKGKKDHLEYFRLVDTGTREPRLKLLKEENEDNLLTRTYWYPEQNKVKFTEEEVRKFSLDSYGENIPFIDGELTIFNNYLFDFWGYYLNAEGLALYGHLKRFAYGSKDWCFPNFDLIGIKMDKSRPTIHNFMQLLERYGFAYKFGVSNRSREGVEEGPIFKLRKKVPLLTKALIYGNPDIQVPDDAPPHIKKALIKEKNGLPERLRKEHEKYVKTLINSNEKVTLESDIDFEEIYNKWHQFGEIIKASKKETSKSTDQVNIEQSMDKSESKLLEFIKAYISGKVSKPSFDTWFKDILLKKEENSVLILAPTDFSKDWLEQKYDELIKAALIEYELDTESLTYQVIK